MSIVVSKTVKENWNHQFLFIIQIASIVCCTSKFACYMIMIADFIILFPFFKFTIADMTCSRIFKFQFIFFAHFHRS